MTVQRPWPTSLTFLRAARALRIVFDTGESFELPFEMLRVYSPSAEVRGHHAGEEKLVLGKADVSVRDAQNVGRYAVRLVFDDGHDSGLYSWDYLYELGRNRDAKIAAYAEAVAKAERAP